MPRASGRAHGFDLGATYTAAPMARRVNPKAWSPRWSAGVCPLDLFTEPLKAQLYSLVQRTSEPQCGAIGHDVAGTASGVWLGMAGLMFGQMEDREVPAGSVACYDNLTAHGSGAGDGVLDRHIVLKVTTGPLNGATATLQYRRLWRGSVRLAPERRDLRPGDALTVARPASAPMPSGCQGARAFRPWTTERATAPARPWSIALAMRLGC